MSVKIAPIARNKLNGGNMVIIGNNSLHWHLFVGPLGGNPCYDVPMSNINEAVSAFFKISDTFAADRINPIERFNFERYIYDTVEEEPDNTWFIDVGYIRIMLVNCDSCDQSELTRVGKRYPSKFLLN
jgi:hypothetical protein